MNQNDKKLTPAYFNLHTFIKIRFDVKINYFEIISEILKV